MAAVFLKLLNLSISASWLVLAVLALRLVLRRAPKWVNVLLWGMVALRLMLPFSIESALSLIPSAETLSPAAVQSAPAPTITSGVSVIDNAVNPSLSEHFAATPEASVNPLYVWTEIAGWVWLIGLGAMLLYALVSYLRLHRRVSVSLPHLSLRCHFLAVHPRRCKTTHLSTLRSGRGAAAECTGARASASRAA